MDIKAFLLAPAINEEKEVIVSDRCRDANGNIAPFKIRRIDQETNDKLRLKATIKEIKNGHMYERFNDTKYGDLLVQACVVEPDFSNTQMCEHYGTVDPLVVPRRMLLPGEYTKLLSEINEFNGFGSLDSDLQEASKNS